MDKIIALRKKMRDAYAEWGESCCPEKYQEYIRLRNALMEALHGPL